MVNFWLFHGDIVFRGGPQIYLTDHYFLWSGLLGKGPWLWSKNLLSSIDLLRLILQFPCFHPLHIECIFLEFSYLPILGNANIGSCSFLQREMPLYGDRDI